MLKIDNFAGRNAAELAQWSEQFELSATACAVWLFLQVFGTERGVQLPLGTDDRAPGTWTGVIGRSRRMLGYALGELIEAGIVRRFTRHFELPEPWEHAGRSYTRVQAVSVVYLTPLGADLGARRGESRVLTAGKGRVLRAYGAVGNLLRLLSRNLRAIAGRCGSVGSHCTPSASLSSEALRGKKPDRHWQSELVDGAAETDCRALEPSAGAPAGHGATPAGPYRGSYRGGAGSDVWRENQARKARSASVAAAVSRDLDALEQARAFTVEVAYGPTWAAANERGRRWLRARFEPLRARLVARFLEREKVRAGGGVQC